LWSQRPLNGLTELRGSIRLVNETGDAFPP
jgi:hypothetical protein